MLLGFRRGDRPNPLQPFSTACCHVPHAHLLRTRDAMPFSTLASTCSAWQIGQNICSNDHCADDAVVCADTAPPQPHHGFTHRAETTNWLPYKNHVDIDMSQRTVETMHAMQGWAVGPGQGYTGFQNQPLRHRYQNERYQASTATLECPKSARSHWPLSRTVQTSRQLQQRDSQSSLCCQLVLF